MKRKEIHPGVYQENQDVFIFVAGTEFPKHSSVYINTLE